MDRLDFGDENICIEADDPKLRSLAVFLLFNRIYSHFFVALEACCGSEKIQDGRIHRSHRLQIRSLKVTGSYVDTCKNQSLAEPTGGLSRRWLTLTRPDRSFRIGKCWPACVFQRALNMFMLIARACVWCEGMVSLSVDPRLTE